MENNLDDVEVVKNTDTQRFEMEVEGHVAFIKYLQEGRSITLVHTEVPEELGGRGIGKLLVAKTLKLIKEEDLSMHALCPFVAAYVKRHPNWREE